MKHCLPYSLTIVALVALLAPFQTASGQTAERHTGLSLGVSGLQYQGNYGSDYWDFSRNQYAPTLAISQYLTRGLDLHAQLIYGKLTGRSSTNSYFTTNLVNANLGFRFRLNNGWALKENAFFQPYLIAASGLVYANQLGLHNGERIDEDKGYVDLMGAGGFTFRLGGGVGLFVQSGLHMPLEANLDGVTDSSPPRWADRFLQHSAGLTFNLGQAPDADEDEVPDRLDRCPDTPAGVEVTENGCPLDGDEDGVPDYQDECPTELGTVELRGCADRDADGVTDSEDACPDAAGKPELKGCPDVDNDRVIDSEDKCPDTPAGAEVDAVGCSAAPNPDADADGVPNETDRCPSSAGPASNQGCPEIRPETRQRLQQATQFIRFEVNKAALLASSYPTLDTIARILQQYPDYTLSIAGHTDSKGPGVFNLRLSRERAIAARDYMVGKGLAAERVDVRGYGPKQPVVSNATETGRARNRRVEFDLFLTGNPNAAEVKYGPEPTPASVTPVAQPKKKVAPKKKKRSGKRPVAKKSSKKSAAAKQGVRAKAGAAKRPSGSKAARRPTPRPPARPAW